MKINDAIIGLVLLGISIFLFITAEGFRGMPGVSYGPKVFPQIICTVMGVASILLIYSGVREYRATGLAQLEEWTRSPRAYAIFAAILGGVLFYILASGTLGYMLSSTIMLSAMLTVVRGPRRTVTSVLIAVVASSIIYTLFSFLLRVPLPLGIVERTVLGYS